MSRWAKIFDTLGRVFYKNLSTTPMKIRTIVVIYILVLRVHTKLWFFLYIEDLLQEMKYILTKHLPCYYL